MRQLPTASRMVFGCMGLGGDWSSSSIAEADIARAQAAVEAALQIGVTLFDHADIYSRGRAEQVMGMLFKRQASLRDTILLQSKCGIRFADASGPKRYDLSGSHIVTSVDNSLRRLNTEHLDILLLHRPDPLMEPAEVAQAWHQIKTSGKARYLGVSNMHAGQMRALAAVLDEPLLVNQLEMSLLKLDWLETGSCFNDQQGALALNWCATLEYCQTEGVQLQAWGALAHGALSGADLSDAPENLRRTAQLVQDLANEQRVSREAIVLAWLMQHPARIQPVIGTTDPARIRACGEAHRVELSREQWYRLYVSSRGRELP
jgi:predicted oxidoreductase